MAVHKTIKQPQHAMYCDSENGWMTYALSELDVSSTELSVKQLITALLPTLYTDQPHCDVMCKLMYAHAQMKSNVRVATRLSLKQCEI